MQLDFDNIELIYAGENVYRPVKGTVTASITAKSGDLSANLVGWTGFEVEDDFGNRTKVVVRDDAVKAIHFAGAV